MVPKEGNISVFLFVKHASCRKLPQRIPIMLVFNEFGSAVYSYMVYQMESLAYKVTRSFEFSSRSPHEIFNLSPDYIHRVTAVL